MRDEYVLTGVLTARLSESDNHLLAQFYLSVKIAIEY